MYLKGKKFLINKLPAETIEVIKLKQLKKMRRQDRRRIIANLEAYYEIRSV